jgi:ABC-type Fe3+ transport system substrate-binding protein
MFVQPVDYFLAVWFVLAGLSTAYVAWDQFRNNPEPVVMKWGFILVTLYMGPLGLLIYVLADKEPRPGEHEAFTKPLWKQASARPSTASPETLRASFSQQQSPPRLGCRCGSILSWNTSLDSPSACSSSSRCS